MTNTEIIEQKRHRGEELDLSDPAQAAIISKMFGGEEHFSKEYPDLYELFRNSQMKKLKSTAGDMQGFQNASYVVDVVYDKKGHCAYAAGRTFLTGKAKRLYCNLAIYKNGEMIGREMEFFQDSDNVKIECSSVTFDEPSEKVVYKGELYVAWQPYGENTIRAMGDSSISEVVEGTGEEFVDTMTVADPAYKKSTSGPVRVALIRRDDKVDYCFPDAKRDGKGNVAMHLNIGGKAVLSDNHKCDRAPYVDAVLNQVSSGTIFYDHAPIEGEIAVSKDKKTIEWKLSDDWCNSVPESVIAGNRDYLFDMKLQFYCNACGTYHQLIISSEDYPQYEEYRFFSKVPAINVLWGCLAKGTSISMVNGAVKKIEEIRKGDEILSDEGKAVKVVNVVTGSEDIIYNLRIETGEEVRATYAHPFYGEDGPIALSDITSNTRLKKKDGSYATVFYCYPEHYGDMVYSIETEGGKSFVANGIISGTHSDQGRFALQTNETNQELDPHVTAEIEKLKKDFAEGRI